MSTTTIATTPAALASDPAMLRLARSIGGKMAERSGFARHADDLVSAALMGLVKASRGWRPSLGVPFRAYALTRIRGAVLDEMRDIAGAGFASVPRTVRRNSPPVVYPHGIDPATTHLPVGWEVESEDEVRVMLDRVGPRGAIVADYFLRADRSTLKRAGAARGLSESRACMIVEEVALTLGRQLARDNA